MFQRTATTAPGSVDRVERAVVVTSVGVDAVAVVALFAGLLDAITAVFDLAGLGAAVVVGLVAVVALLAGLLDPVATKLGAAGRAAAVVVGGVSVVALLHPFDTVVAA